MSDPEEGPNRPEPIQTVYTQYWQHIRHVEDEMWAFTRIWAIVITAIFTIMGADLPTAAKVGAGVFGTILSVLGFFIVYTLRIPFFDFFLTIELIARRDFGLDEGYRRFEDDPDFRLSKGIDIHDILVSIYTLVAGLMVVTIGIILGWTLAGITVGVALMAVLAIIYLRYVVPKFDETVEDMAEEIRNE